MLEDYSLRALSNELIKELDNSIGDKNIVKLSYDIQLPDKFTGNSDTIKQAIRDVATFLSEDLINGAITIEILKRSEHGRTITIHVQITGSGVVKGKDGIRKIEDESWFKGFPYMIHRATTDKEATFAFYADLTTTESTRRPENLPFDRKSVLIAEDNEINAMVFSSFLEEWGCKATVAVNGAAAVSLALDHTYDVILMDIYMPVMNGHKATSKIREFNTEVPIIALTASTEEADVLEAKRAGVSDYLVKPVSSSQLLNALKKYL
jgi:CheY-like chemotaxis protein